MSEPISVRMDKWLWAIRLYKTRSLATVACRGGKVSIQGQKVKPSREVSVGDVVSVQRDDITLTIKVLDLLDHRVGAPLVSAFMENQTPEEEYEEQKLRRTNAFLIRSAGQGRPTKKDRREI